MMALFWMMAGVGNVVAPIWRAWAEEKIDVKALLIADAARNETAWLLPGMMAVALTGFAWGAAAGWDLPRTGWLLALVAVFSLDFFIFLPLLGIGLRRVRRLAVEAQQEGEVTEELRDALADNVPLVFSTLILLSIPLMLWLPVYKPF
jgi:uncharacterized membrane protein